MFWMLFPSQSLLPGGPTMWQWPSPNIYPMRKPELTTKRHHMQKLWAYVKRVGGTHPAPSFSSPTFPVPATAWRQPHEKSWARTTRLSPSPISVPQKPWEVIEWPLLFWASNFGVVMQDSNWNNSLEQFFRPSLTSALLLYEVTVILLFLASPVLFFYLNQNHFTFSKFSGLIKCSIHPVLPCHISYVI